MKISYSVPVLPRPAQPNRHVARFGHHTLPDVPEKTKKSFWDKLNNILDRGRLAGAILALMSAIGVPFSLIAIDRKTEIGRAANAFDKDVTAFKRFQSSALPESSLMTEDVQQKMIASLFRNQAERIARYKRDEKFQKIIALLPKTDLTEEEATYTLTVAEKTKGDKLDSYRDFEGWLDRVVAPRVAPEMLETLKAESKAFYKKLSIVETLPIGVLLYGSLSAISIPFLLTSALTRRL